MENDVSLPVDYNKLNAIERRKVREEYVKLQDGKCQYCGEPLDGLPAENIRHAYINWNLFPGGIKFTAAPIHLHHNHDTGMTLGAVHARCNAHSWYYLGE